MFVGNRTRSVLALVVMTMAIVGLTTTSAWADVVLKVDFNSNQDGGGDSTAAGDPGLSAAAHNQEGWSSYHANHEVAAEFSTADYGGITVTPAWPNTTANTVQQSIDRSATNDDNWDNALDYINLVTDWIGIDTRTGNGGNGDWNGTTGTPTYMTLTLGGLAAGNYAWTSFHHDTEHCHGPFAVWLSTDGGATFTQLDDGVMTDSTTGGTPDSGAPEAGPDPYELSSTYRLSFVATGADVVVRFAPYADASGVHRQIWGLNGFEIEKVVTLQASGPIPGNGATDIVRDTDLTWKAGLTAQTHNVYLGTSIDDVTNATVDNPLGVLVSQGQTETLYDIEGVLEFGETYYWRVDEVAADGTITVGNVWTFTVEPVAYAIEGVVATSDLVPIEGQGPENAVNGSGLNENGEHSVDNKEMWTANVDPDGPEMIQFEFDRLYKMHEMTVWNHNLSFEAFLGLGLKDVTIEYSADGVDWMVFGDVELPQAPGQPTYTGSVVSLDGIPAKFIRFVINSTWLSTVQLGLAEVSFSYIPAYAREPQPADGATDVTPDTLLSWRAGREAVSHDVYLGTDPNALDLAGTTTMSSFAPENLVLGTTYAWSVDEVNEADDVMSWASDVWTFTTQELILIDGFEGYDDNIDAGTTIWQTWVDSLDDPTNGGSQVGYDTSDNGTFGETVIVHGGQQSMPLKYNNTTAAFSEATRTFSPAQDWTQFGIKGLTLWFQGDLANTEGQMYVKINGQKVSYDGGSDSLLRNLWQLWYIDLAEVPGVNLANVTELEIGVEGGTGLVFIDDIALSAASRQLVTPVEPDNTGLVGQWTFDEGSGTAAADSSGNNNHGTIQGSAQWVAAGKVGGALAFDGVDDLVVVTQNSGLPIYNSSDANEYSVAMWVKGGPQNDMRVFSEGSSTDNNPLLNLGTQNGGTTGQFAAYIRPDAGTAATLDHPLSVVEPFDDTWHHIAWVDNNGAAVLYVDGQLDATDFSYTRGTMALDTTTIGGILRAAPSHFFFGEIDEVYVYNRALSQGEVAWLAGRTNPFDK